MSYELIVKPLARVDILDTFDWYEEQREGLGARFLNKVELAIAAIENHPLGYQVIDKKYGARRNLARPFPHMIVYTIEGNTILVILSCTPSAIGKYGEIACEQRSY